MSETVPNIPLKEVTSLYNQNLLSLSSWYFPNINPTHGVKCQPYCAKAESYWAYEDSAMLKINANVVPAFNHWTEERLPIFNAKSQIAEVEYKRYGEVTGRTVQPILKNQQIVSPPFIGTWQNKLPLFVRWPRGAGESECIEVLSRFEEMKKTLFVLAVRSFFDF